MKKFLKKIIPDWMLSAYHFKLALLAAVVYGWPSRRLKVIGVTGTKGKSTVVVLAGKILQSADPLTSSGYNPPAPLCARGAEEITLSQSPPSKGGEEKLNPSQPPFKKGGGKIGWISSLTINDGKEEKMNPFHMTMPGRFFVQKTLRQMVKNGCEYALVEVTSEGIKQHRHRFIKWAGAVFTNLAPEHLEAHGGFANYRASKMKLFAAAAKNKNSFGVYNLDDENAEWFLKYSVGKKYGYSMSLRGDAAVSGGDAAIPRDCFAGLAMTDVKLSANGAEFTINGVKFKTKLLGEFNVYNCAAAAATGEACGVELEDAARALAKVQSIPGRLELIDEGQDFLAVVDLAHTPDSFEKVFGLFNELRNLTHPNPLFKKERENVSRIIAVFGSAGGGRDKWKRPELGRIASRNCDNIIICNEDPYDESAEEICNEIAKGCITPPQSPFLKGGERRVEIILDRRSAIARALSLAGKGDIVLVLGKGTEQTMVLGHQKIAWDDRRIVKEELKRLLAKNPVNF